MDSQDARTAIRELEAAVADAYEMAWWAAGSDENPDWESLGALLARVLTIARDLLASADPM